MLRIIGIASGKGGVGKTTTCINLAAALQELGEKNVIVDTNINNANLSIQLGFQYIPITLQDVLAGDVNILQTVRIHPTGLRVVPAAISPNKTDIEFSGLREILKPLDQAIILDFPPGLSQDVLSLMKACDEMLIVTNPEMTAITDALKTIEAANRLKKVVSGIILNRIRRDRYELSVKEVEMMCEIPVIAQIPEDENIRKANFHNLPVIYYKPYSKSSIQYFQLAARITGKRFSLPRFFSIKRMFRIL